MTKEEVIQAANNVYSNALIHCNNDKELFAYAFIGGMLFQKNGIVPKSEFEEMVDKINNK